MSHEFNYPSFSIAIAFANSLCILILRTVGICYILQFHSPGIVFSASNTLNTIQFPLFIFSTVCQSVMYYFHFKLNLHVLLSKFIFALLTVEKSNIRKGKDCTFYRKHCTLLCFDIIKIMLQIEKNNVKVMLILVDA